MGKHSYIFRVSFSVLPFLSFILFCTVTLIDYLVDGHQIPIKNILFNGEGSEKMGHHRSKKRRKREKEEQLKKAQENTQGFSLSSLLTDLDLKTLSGQIKNIAGYIETFNQVAALFKQADTSVNPKQGQEKGQNFNLINMLKDKDSLNSILEMVSSNMPESAMEASTEKKITPLNMEDHHSEDK